MQRRLFLQGLAAMAAYRLGEAAAVEFAPVLSGRTLSFPADHGAHPDFRTEWWYATGWLKRRNGNPLGFQTTFFRVRTGIGEDSRSKFAPRQLLLAHAAIADPQLGRLRHDERTARAGFGRAGFSTDDTGVWIGDWRLERKPAHYVATVRGESFSYALDMVPDGVPMLNGRQGFSQKAAERRHASYYYSRPQLRVAGEITLDGQRELVSGQAWLDHEWSSELMPDGAQGWDWIGINLDDGGALMAFRMRDQAQNTLWAAGTWRSAAGLRSLDADTLSFEPQREWRSPRTGIRYPVVWHLRIGDRVFTISPLIDDQELDSRRSTGAVYWEGAVILNDGAREIGRGYLEMTGYGERIRVG